MAERKMITVDGNTACASLHTKTNEVIAIYPITPPRARWESWPMSSRPRRDQHFEALFLWLQRCRQKAARQFAVHGALQTGALTTTFTASQGLLLMIPNMYKIAGELTSTVFHVSAVSRRRRSPFSATTAISRRRGLRFAMLAGAARFQEAQDFALISQAAALASRVPFVHFFDGFRTSSEVNKIVELSDAKRSADDQH